MSELDVKPVSVHAATSSQHKSTFETRPGNDRPVSGKTMPETDAPDMEVLARKLNLATRSIGRDLRFQVDMETGSSVIQVLDRETGEIIRQIPPESAKTYISEQGKVALRLFDDLV